LTENDADDTSLILIVPRKIRQVIADLERAGFVNRGGKGSHRNYVHSTGTVVTVSGKPGDDAPHYLEKQARRAIEAVSNETQ
jgi:predicted RNA binding protein YcfA (HicA-like mRNA interferase family)